MTGRSPQVIHECATCGHEMQVPGRYAGTVQHCRRCGAEFEVAGAGDAGFAEVTGPAPPPVVRRRLKRVAPIVVGLALVGAGLLLLRVLVMDQPTASNRVRETLVETVMPFKWAEAPLAGGTAVVLNDTAAYWVREGVVYACDGNARAWSPGVPDAPPEIDLLAVERAVRAR